MYLYCESQPVLGPCVCVWGGGGGGGGGNWITRITLYGGPAGRSHPSGGALANPVLCCCLALSTLPCAILS